MPCDTQTSSVLADELILVLPYLNYLHSRGVPIHTQGAPGSEPWYFFSPDHAEVRRSSLRQATSDAAGPLCTTQLERLSCSLPICQQLKLSLTTCNNGVRAGQASAQLLSGERPRLSCLAGCLQPTSHSLQPPSRLQGPYSHPDAHATKAGFKFDSWLPPDYKAHYGKQGFLPEPQNVTGSPQAAWWLARRDKPLLVVHNKYTEVSSYVSIWHAAQLLMTSGDTV